MMAIIEITGSAPKAPRTPRHPVDELLGEPLDVTSLHPEIQEMYVGAFQQLGDMDKVGALDN
jgi:hypothetical protein